MKLMLSGCSDELIKEFYQMKSVDPADNPVILPVDTAHNPEFSVASLSIRGLKSHNEDATSYLIPDAPLLATKGAVFIIADGVSSAGAGAQASRCCVDEFLYEFFKTPDFWSTQHSAQKILSTLNRDLFRRSCEYRDMDKGYITTLSILVIKSNQAYIFHIGDSRISLIRGEQFIQLTKDHLSEEDVGESPYLVRAMGMDVGLQVDFRKIEVEVGDQFFLSSDGVHDFVSEADIAEELDRCGEAFHKACEGITVKALAAQSDDNISCQLLRINKLNLETLAQADKRLSKIPFPPDLSAGMKLDKYRVESLLCASAHSQLYCVTDMSSHEKLVMKTPSINYVDDLVYIESFLTEAWVGSRIEHEHIVKVRPDCGDKTFLYYIMEYVEGETLEVWMNRNTRPRPAVVFDIIKQIASGLEALHTKEIIHQDLKPGNIMVSAENKVTIIDLGSVYVAGLEEIYHSVRNRAVVGSANYTDPNCMAGKRTGVKGDLFSLASVSYEMMTGKLPYGKKLDSFNLHRDLTRLKYIPSYQVNRDIPLWFDGALRRAVNINVGERYDSIADFINDLKTPNPEYLTEVYISQYKETLPVFKVWRILGLVWVISLFLAIAVFVL